MKTILGRFWLPGVLSCLYILGFWLESHQQHVSSSAAKMLPVAPGFSDASLDVLTSTSSTKEKKLRFFAFLQPLVAVENQYITQQRAWLEALQPEHLTPQEQSLLQQLAVDYKVNVSSDLERYQELLLRVDTIPLELVLAQAANESSWGRSRFAREGNNLFGQWCFSPGCGLVPSRRTEGASHEVAKFVSVQQSVRAYLRNLNTFAAYQALRQLRAKLRRNDQVVNGLILAETLQNYSERGNAYVQELKSMMRVNQALVTQVVQMSHSE
ncbi:glucosaminidase domain-containing protein [Oceanospirillum beijerinckii]|uniref:glucosaminidase domain-containing protein n=1 Tax=Oceanospirillum beijerinckii TaxID=64976 RepID=UPI00041E3BD2|nr:glucosaminidase domain-containing protein [Oceanospirillum beijerinckii]MAC45314.1 hypothetical protein [Oceanospirillum sp.]